MVNELQSSIPCDQSDAIGRGLTHGLWFSDYGGALFTTKEGFKKWIEWNLDISKAL